MTNSSSSKTRQGTDRYSPAQVAQVCHAANSALQEVQEAYGGTAPSGPWIAEPPERVSIVTGAIESAREAGITSEPVPDEDAELVRKIRSGVTPRKHHNDWAAAMKRLGWKRGPHDPAARTHPNICDWDELDQFQRDKDRLFLAIVVAMTLTD